MFGEREVDFVVRTDIAKARFLPCAFLCLACDGPCDWSVLSGRFSGPSMSRHPSIVVRLR